ncbi:hypothetical protein FQR65_LT01237 [Abscondita terminalis]|nr:hypothetical protein FQR65_LT01237 [Abscondita terminalis]
MFHSPIFEISSNTKEQNKNLDANTIPFFPKTETQLICNNTLRVTWFEKAFSQSNYSYEECVDGSNACTLIAVITAAKCHENNIEINGPEKPTCIQIIVALAHGMLIGNSIHESLKLQRVLSNVNLTVPQALNFSKDVARGLVEWKSELHKGSMHKGLYPNLRKRWRNWIEHCKRDKKRYIDLYVILIYDYKSVLFVFNRFRDTVTMLDSHRHWGNKGAVIATVERAKLKILCDWFGELINRCYNSSPHIYELSYLYFKEHYPNSL